MEGSIMEEKTWWSGGDRERGLVILGVNISQDQEQLARDFVERYRLAYPIGRDVSGTIGSLYAVTGTPTAFLSTGQGDWSIGMWVQCLRRNSDNGSKIS
jgi:hypothetical protein